MLYTAEAHIKIFFPYFFDFKDKGLNQHANILSDITGEEWWPVHPIDNLKNQTFKSEMFLCIEKSLEWCKENTYDDYAFHNAIIYFKSERDLMLFKLSFSKDL